MMYKGFYLEYTDDQMICIYDNQGFLDGPFETMDEAKDVIDTYLAD